MTLVIVASESNLHIVWASVGAMPGSVDGDCQVVLDDCLNSFVRKRN